MKKALLAAVLAAAALVAQDKPVSPAPINTAYRLEYTVLEMEGTKKISAKNYTIIVRDERHGRLRVGTRVPYSTSGGTQFNYLDVGVNIDAAPSWIDSTSIRLNTTLEISAAGTMDAAGNRPPTLRTFNDSLETVVPLDKPVIITSQDEPGTTTTFQVQVLVKIVK